MSYLNTVKPLSLDKRDPMEMVYETGSLELVSASGFWGLSPLKTTLQYGFCSQV